MKAWSLAVVSALLLSAAAGVAWHLWSELDGVDIGWQGYLALGLGVLMSLIVGVGLMALVFYSARRGYDEQGGAPDPPPGDNDPKP